MRVTKTYEESQMFDEMMTMTEIRVLLASKWKLRQKLTNVAKTEISV